MSRLETGTVTINNDPLNRRVLYDQALRCIDREENLIHYRMSWGLQWSLGGLAALFALQNSNLPEQVKAYVDVGTSLFGLIVCYIAFIAIDAAHQQSWFVIRTLCEALGVKDHQWDNEFIRPYGNAHTVHGRARWFSKFLFLGIAAIWLMIIASVFLEGVSIQFRMPELVVKTVSAQK